MRSARSWEKATRIFHYFDGSSFDKALGLGTELARFALQDIRAGGERVKPSCPFVADYMDRHPDTADMRAS